MTEAIPSLTFATTDPQLSPAVAPPDFVAPPADESQPSDTSKRATFFTKKNGDMYRRPYRPKLTREERAICRVLRDRGVSDVDIARKIDCSSPSVYRAIQNRYACPDDEDSDFEHLPDDLKLKYPSAQKRSRYEREFRSSESPSSTVVSKARLNSSTGRTGDCSNNIPQKRTRYEEGNHRDLPSRGVTDLFRLARRSTGNMPRLTKNQDFSAAETSFRAVPSSAHSAGGSSQSRISVIKHEDIPDPAEVIDLTEDPTASILHFLKTLNLSVDRFMPILRDGGVKDQESLQELANLPPDLQDELLTNLMKGNWSLLEVQVLKKGLRNISNSKK